MKKIAAILLAMVMLFTAGPCSKPDDNDGKNGTQNGEQGSTENGQQGGTENGEEDGTLNGGVDPEDLLYKDIPRYMSVSPLTQKISFTGDDTVLNIAGPDGWVLRNAEDGSFHITAAGCRLSRRHRRYPDPTGWPVLRRCGRCQASACTDGSDRYRRRW